MAVIAIDMDSTLIDLEHKPLPGAKDAVNRLRELGHKIIIHSCNRKEWIEQCLNNADIRYDRIWDKPGKPMADLYLDDKGYRFPYNGDWNVELPDILFRVEGLDNRKW